MKRSLALAIAAMLLTATPCLADLASSVTMDWSTFKVSTFSFTGGAEPTFNWLAQETAATAEADTDGGSFDIMDDLSEGWNNPTPTEAEAITAKAQSLATRQFVDVDNWTLSATATSSKDTSNAGAFNYSFASVDNWGEFEVLGQGLVVFEVDWMANLQGDLGDDINNTVVNLGMGSILFGQNSDSQSDSHVHFLSDEDGAGAYSGKMVVSVYNSDEMATGEFWAWVNADSQSQNVPEPSSFLLMLGGLGFFGWAARRKSK